MGNLKRRRAPTVGGRRRTGCLCCRKRRIKCDETKPSCLKCIKSSYKCVWPTRKKSLSHINQFQLEKNRKRAIGFVNINTKSAVTYSSNSPYKSDAYRSWVRFTKNPNSYKGINGKSHDTKLIDVKKESEFDLLFRKYLSDVNGRYFKLYLNCGNFGTYVIGSKMNHIEIKLFDAFSRGFLVEVTPLLADHHLLPGSITLPLGVNNPILRQIFYTCGAFFLSLGAKEFVPVSKDYLAKSIFIVNCFLKDFPVFGNEDWLMIVSLCFHFVLQFLGESMQGKTANISLCLRTIYILGSKVRKHGKRRNSGDFVDMTNWLSELQKTTQFAHLNSLGHENWDYNSQLSQVRRLINNIGLKLNLQYAAHAHDLNFKPVRSHHNQLNDLPSLTLTESGFVSCIQKTVSESFLYNYTINLFGCGSNIIDKIASPFEIFDLYRNILAYRVSKSSIPWMNNPIMGASLDSFEIAAKTNWLAAHFPLDVNNQKIAGELLRNAQFYCQPLLPSKPLNNGPTEVLSRITESCYFADMVAKACFIFLSKLLNPSLKNSDSSIQAALNRFLENLSNITIQSRISSICIWPMVVAGSAALNIQQKNYLLYRLRNFEDCVRFGDMRTASRYLERIWDSSIGLNSLLDYHIRKTLFDYA